MFLARERYLVAFSLALHPVLTTSRAGACPAAPGTVVRPRHDVATDSAKGDLPAIGAIPGPFSFPRSIESIGRYNSECRPSLSADGTRLVFEASASNGPAYDPVNQLETTFYPYQAEWDGTAWTNLRGLDRDLFEGHSFPRLSADGETLLTTSAGEIYFADRDAESWTSPTLLGGEINDLNPGESNISCSISRDGSEIYFASDRAGGSGSNDVWVCRLIGTTTDSLTNLGPGVNSEGSEVRPAIGPNGRYLVFSDFVGGRSSLDYGGADLYISELVGTTWSVAEPLPAPVNNHHPACTAHWASESELVLGGGVNEGGGGAEDLWVTTIGVEAGAGTPSLRPSLEIARDDREATGFAGGPAPAIRPPGRWTRIASLFGANIVEDLIETSSGVLLAATSDAGYVFRSVDGGESWIRRSLGPLSTRIYCLEKLSDGTILAGTYPNGRVYESANEGWSWSALAALPPWITAIRAIAELDSGDLLVGVAPETLTTGGLFNEGRIFRSTDLGASWSSTGGLRNVAAAVLAIHETPDGTIWAGNRAYSGSIHRSLNGGLTWLPVTPDFGTHVSVGAAADFFRDSRGTLWAMGWGHGVGAYLMRYMGGVDWEVESPFQRGSEYNDSFVFEMVEDDRGWLYVGMQPSGGSPAWISTDGGLTWNATSPMEGAKEMLALLHTQDERVLAGTSGDGGIWEWELSVVTAPTPGPAAVSGARGRRGVARWGSRR